MHNSKQVQRKPMVFKSMSSNFLRHALHLMGHIEIYHVVSFYHESMVIKKPMIQFIKIIQQGELSWPTASQKNHCCVYRRFLGSFLSAKVLGGLDARAENFPACQNRRENFRVARGGHYRAPGKNSPRRRIKATKGQGIFSLAARPSRPLICRKRLLCQGTLCVP